MDNQPRKFAHADFFSWALLAFLFFYMFALNYFMPLHRDDYNYSLIWGTRDKIAAWTDVFQSLHNHYFSHGGRMVAYFVLDSFLFLGKQWYNPFNAFLYVALIVLMYWHSQREVSLRFNPYILLSIIAFTWLGLPHFAEVTLWMAGATGYLFSAVLILSFLLPYHFAFLEKPLWRNSLAASAGMFFAGIAAGWTIENTAASMTFVVAVATLYFYWKHTLQVWMISGLCGAITGLALLVAAPGNYVRYAGSKTKLIYHFTNSLAAGVETLFYALPVLLFLLFAWRLLLINYAGQKGIPPTSRPDRGRLFSSIALITGILSLLASYLNDNFFSTWLGNLLFANVAAPLGFATAKLRAQLFNTLSGLEEMLLYLLTITQIFHYACQKAYLQKNAIRAIAATVSWRDIATAYPAIYYVAFWLVLAIANHFVMLASPRFPGRAAFGSVVFLVIGVAGVFTIREIRHYFLAAARQRALVFLAGILLLPTMTATLHQYSVIAREDHVRMAYVSTMASQGMTRLEVEPISVKNRVLRHVYFEDLDNIVSKTHICSYYGLEDIQLKRRQ